MHISDWYDSEAVNILQKGGVGVGLTDTVYGVLALAENSEAVDRVYELKNRNLEKALIILLNDKEQLRDFGVSDESISRTEPYWPGPMTLVLPTKTAPEYLRRGKNSLAFRLPDSKQLRKLISKTGPLVAPSANPESEKPATSIKQAKKYFGDKVDFYVGSNKPVLDIASTIFSLEGEFPLQLR